VLHTKLNLIKSDSILPANRSLTFGYKNSKIARIMRFLRTILVFSLFLLLGAYFRVCDGKPPKLNTSIEAGSKQDVYRDNFDDEYSPELELTLSDYSYGFTKRKISITQKLNKKYRYKFEYQDNQKDYSMKKELDNTTGSFESTVWYVPVQCLELKVVYGYKKQEYKYTSVDDNRTHTPVIELRYSPINTGRLTINWRYRNLHHLTDFKTHLDRISHTGNIGYKQKFGNHLALTTKYRGEWRHYKEETYPDLWRRSFLVSVDYQF